MQPITFYDLNTAFAQVRANQGCAGIDQVTIAQFDPKVRRFRQCLPICFWMSWTRPCSVPASPMCAMRYADDFLILGKNPAEARQALQLSVEVLERLDLELDEEDIVSFDQGFKYLGVLFLKSMVMQPIAKPKKDCALL